MKQSGGSNKDFFRNPDNNFFIYRINAELYFNFASVIIHSINKKQRKMKKVILIVVVAMFSTVMFAQTQDIKKTEPKKEPAKTETLKPTEKKATTATMKPVKKETGKKKTPKVQPKAVPSK
jgi:hypothetical protein